MQAFAALPRAFKTGLAIATLVVTAALAWFVTEGFRSARLETSDSALMTASRKYDLTGSLASLPQAMVVYAQQAALQPQAMGPDWDAWMSEHIERMRSDLLALQALNKGEAPKPGQAQEGALSADAELLAISALLQRHLNDIEDRLRAGTSDAGEPFAQDLLAHRAMKALSIAEMALAESASVQRLAELAREQDLRGRENMLQEHQMRYSRSILAIAAVLLMGYVALIALLIAVINVNSASAARDQAVSERLAVGAQRAQVVQAKVQFLRMVSHELRTPLQTLYSASDTLENSLKGTALEPTLRRLRAAARQLGYPIFVIETGS